MIKRTVQGRRHVCRLDASPLASATAWLRFYERFWTQRLGVLEDVLREPQSEQED